MTNVIIVYDAESIGDLRDKLSNQEMQSADIVVGMNADGTEGVIFKDRYGPEGSKVLVVE